MTQQPHRMKWFRVVGFGSSRSKPMPLARDSPKVGSLHKVLVQGGDFHATLCSLV